MLDSSVFGLCNDLKLSFFSHLDDDLVDRFNYYYTPLLFILFGIISGSKQYFGSAIECFLPPVLAAGGIESYAEQYCWVTNTYYVPVGETVPDAPQRPQYQLRYYQWVPFVLALQAIMCYLPCIVWRFMNWKTGVDLRVTVQLANNVENVNAETREKNCEAIAGYLHHTFQTHYRSKQALKNGSRLNAFRQFSFGPALIKHGGGIHLTTAYLFSKLLYCINVALQLFLVCQFIGASSVAYGFDYLYEILWNNSDESRSRNFPLITLCDIVTRSFANNQRYTVECVLPVNMVNDKLFLFIWWWLLFLGFITVLNMFMWLWHVSSAKSRLQFIRKFLNLAHAECASDKKLCCKFTFNYLKIDGVVIMRLFSYNCGPATTCEVLRQLWLHYLRMHVRRGEPLPRAESPTSTPSATAGRGRVRASSQEKLYRKPRSHHTPDSRHNGCAVNQLIQDDADTVVFMSPHHKQ